MSKLVKNYKNFDEIIKRNQRNSKSFFKKIRKNDLFKSKIY